jgi:fibronectin type 3 domain-containing protein
MRTLAAWFLLVVLFASTADARQKKKHAITLKWEAPVGQVGASVIGYSIYRGDKENGDYKVIAKNVRSLTYRDAAVQSGHTYYYKVTSVDANGRESTAVTTKATVP